MKKWQSPTRQAELVSEALTTDISPDKQTIVPLKEAVLSPQKCSNKDKKVSNKILGKRSNPSVIFQNYENRDPNAQNLVESTRVPSKNKTSLTENKS